MKAKLAQVEPGARQHDRISNGEQKLCFIQHMTQSK